jgi:hypothetical protein
MIIIDHRREFVNEEGMVGMTGVEPAKMGGFKAPSCAVLLLIIEPISGVLSRLIIHLRLSTCLPLKAAPTRNLVEQSHKFLFGLLTESLW